ncbi:TetR/AcrR family transcriptional regulator [Jannaschia formosa]|uniref:TetR/AcrR family transcriptional regulator n=1 Tax=Jannaschia formosa TaxID=2259592 RepID=UPI000E1C39A7|nr:TetR/AcrR family transcriptional regulator [Jannaschia formosa]TFL16851.1 TetR/AcrR family transcriptional regulator [Jannaschia formosa]
MKRAYTQTRRAAAAAETRRRIVEATVALHREVGPRATTVTGIAERAGVDRVTVYKHFPEEADLVAGCQAHWLSLHPPPDLAGLAGIADPEARLSAALGALWDWYARTREMTAHVLRDGPALASFAEVLAGMRAQRMALAEALAAGRAPHPGLLPALMLATDFRTWEVLVHEGGLDHETALALVVGWPP